MGNNVVCVAGDFKAPAPAINTYYYEGVTTCPPSGGDFYEVVTQPCGLCLKFGSNYNIMYSCTPDYTYQDRYGPTDTNCSGTPVESYRLGDVGCTASPSGAYVNECTSKNETTGVSVQTTYAKIDAAKVPTFELDQETISKFKADKLAIESAHDKALAELKAEAMAASPASA
jgi:hypothetical protein